MAEGVGCIERTQLGCRKHKKK